MKLQTDKTIKAITKDYKNALDGQDLSSPCYDPYSAVENLEEVAKGILYSVSEDAEQLDTAIVSHRVMLFAQVVKMMKDESVLEKVLSYVPRKKNKTLHVRRVTQIASLFGMSSQAGMYVLCAQAKTDTSLILEIRNITTTSLEKAEADIITTTNLFRTN